MFSKRTVVLDPRGRQWGSLPRVGGVSLSERVQPARGRGQAVHGRSLLEESLRTPGRWQPPDEKTPRQPLQEVQPAQRYSEWTLGLGPRDQITTLVHWTIYLPFLWSPWIFLANTDVSQISSEQLIRQSCSYFIPTVRIWFILMVFLMLCWSSCYYYNERVNLHFYLWSKGRDHSEDRNEVIDVDPEMIKKGVKNLMHEVCQIERERVRI